MGRPPADESSSSGALIITGPRCICVRYESAGSTTVLHFASDRPSCSDAAGRNVDARALGRSAARIVSGGLRIAAAIRRRPSVRAVGRALRSRAAEGGRVGVQSKHSGNACV